MRFASTAALFFLSAALIGCGGGNAGPVWEAQDASAAATADPFGGVDKIAASNQLFDFAELAYREYFPASSATGAFQQYLYRFYPATGLYLGVDQNSGGVYVMGGSFGTAPSYVGTLARFITPAPLSGNAWQVSRFPSSLWSNVRYLNGCFYALEGDAFVSSADGVQWAAVPLPALPTIPGRGIGPQDMALGDQGFVMVTDNGVPLYSPDGATWSIGTVTAASDATGLAPAYLSIRTVAAGNGVYVASGAQGLMTSSDGVHWISRVGPVVGWQHLAAYQIAFGNGRFVAVGYGGNFYSADGVQWTPIADPAISYGVAFGNGIFVASDGTTTMVSADGVTWAAGGNVADTTTPYSAFSPVSFGSGRFYAYGYKGVDVSVDGIHWSVLHALNSTSPGSLLTGVASNGPDTVLVGWDGLVLQSNDDTQWTATLPSASWNAAGPVDCMNGTCVALASSAVGVLVSTDSSRWSEVALPAATYALSLVTHGNGKFVVVGPDTAYSSTDGAHWTAAPLGVTGAPNALVFADGQFVAMLGNLKLTSTDAVHWTSAATDLPASLYGTMASGNSQFALIDHREGRVYSSTNGSQWQASVTGTAANAVAFGGAAGFVTVGDNGAIWRSPDGASWTRSESGTSANLFGITYGNGQYVAVGNDGTVLVSDDAVNWTLRNTGQPTYMRGVAFDGQAFIAVGGGISVATH